MRVALAYLRASWLAASSYKFDVVISYAAALFAIVPLYFVSGALQPVMARAIRGEGGQYFGFLLVGVSTFYLLPVVVNALPSAVSAAVANGTLETILSTPARLPAVFVGMVSYNVVFVLGRILLTVAVGAALGAPIQWMRIPVAALVLGLVGLSYVPFALLGAAMVVAFRSTGRMPTVVLAVSSLLGGVYYPTRVIPSWLEHVSAYVPLTYGLRALRRVALEAAPLAAVAPDIVLLAGATLVLTAFGALALHAALRYARRAGSLATY